MAKFSHISMVGWMEEPQVSPGSDPGFAALFSSPPTSLQTLVVKLKVTIGGHHDHSAYSYL